MSRFGQPDAIDHLEAAFGQPADWPESPAVDAYREWSQVPPEGEGPMVGDFLAAHEAGANRVVVHAIAPGVFEAVCSCGWHTDELSRHELALQAGERHGWWWGAEVECL